MSGAQKLLEILHGAELRIHFLVVRNGIIGAQRTLPSFGADFVHGHEPEHVHTQVLEAGKLGLHPLEGPLRGELADVHFIDHGVVGPLGVVLLLVCLLAGGQGQHGQ